MNVDNLKRGIEEIEAEVKAVGARLVGDKEDLAPIIDGVIDVYAYLNSNPRIMWILKEPYDDVDKDGNPSGGGWSLQEALERQMDENVRGLVPSYKRMIYAMEGIRHSTQYEDMWYYYEENMPQNLQDIVHINLSKMPGLTNSGDMAEKYELWKDIVSRQIRLYDPQVIILGGTIQYVEDFKEKKEVSIGNYEGYVDVYSCDGRLLLDVYHPACRYSAQKYVDMLSKAVHNHIKIIL